MNSFFRAIRTFALVAFTLTIFAGVSTFAQTFRGTILGSVTDSSGAAVPGATVTIKNLDTGLVRTVTTSEDGSYAAPELPIGNYSVSVEKAGFKTGLITGIKVEVSSERRADVTLQPGQLAQTVIVQGEELPMVESTSNTLGGVVESRIVTSLPVNGRDYQKLIFLVPGVTGSPDQITDSPGSFGIFSVNGARGRANNFLLDGTDMNDGYRNDPAINEAGVFGTPATILPVEAIAELRVASNFEAEYGRSAGAVVNVVTKSGTNQIHGSAFEFFRNNAMDARNYFNDTSLPQNPFHNNQFGGSLGGPIIKDKTFFFIDYEGLREVGAQSTPSCVPTAADITNNTPTGGVNPVIANLLAAGKGWPTPNGTGSCIASQSTVNVPTVQTQVNSNTVLATPFSNNVNGGIIKIDHNFNKDNLLTGRYFLGDSEQSFPLALVGGGALPNYNTFTPTRVQLVSISFVSVMSPTVVNEARVGWNRFAEGFYAQDRHFDPSTIGLDTGAKGIDLGLPRFSVGSFPQLGASSTDTRNRVDSNWHYIDNISWKHGKHDIKAGYEFRRTTVSQNFDSYFKGRLNFGVLANFLAGTPTGGFQYSGRNANRNTFENSHAIYLQDSYRWSSRVTLNLGLRYDYYGLIQEKHGNFTNFNPLTGADIIVGQGRLYQPDYNNVAPRVSVAWDVTGHQKTVVRAGFGIFYDAYSQDMFEGHLPFNSFYDPGPAYSGATGASNPISVGSAFKTPLTSGFQAFQFPSPMSDRFGVDQHLRTPYMENYNLNLQQQITRKMTLQVGYVGSQGHKLLRFRDLNQPTLAQIQAYDYHVVTDSGGNIIQGGCCTPGALLGPGGGGIYYNYEESSGNSIYNSLQTSYRIDNWHGLSTTFNYTWSHSIDDSSDGEDYVPNAAQPDNSQAANRFNRGNSNFDVRNRIAWNFIYEIPNDPGSSMKLIRNGWGLSGTVTIQAGQPFHLNYNFEDDYNGTGEFFARPDVVGPIVYHQSDPTNYLQLTSFAVPCTLDGKGTSAGNCISINPANPGPAGIAACDTSAGMNGGMNTGGCINTMHFGSLGRNSLIGPHFRQFDFSIYKKTQLTERLNMELRFEGYNVLNHPNFANPYLPNFIADAAQQGINPNGTSAGALHLTATGDVGIGYPFLGSGGPRSLQVAAKFTF
jgi:outer membrane receptor protein involved in Fe transport